MILYITSIIISFAVYVFTEWYKGADIGMEDLLTMAIISLLPYVNLMFLAVCLFALLDEYCGGNYDVIIKGRKK